MNFGEMLEILKDGKHRAYRTGWNGIRSWNPLTVIQVPKEMKEREERFIKGIEDSIQSIQPDYLEDFKNPTYIELKKERALISPLMFIYVVKGRVIPNSEVREPLKSWLNGKDMDIVDHIDMKTTDGKIVSGWLASQTDMLSDDWNIVEPIPVKFAPKGEGIQYVQVPKTFKDEWEKVKEDSGMNAEIKRQEDWAKKAEEVLNDPEIEKRLDQERLLKPLYNKDPSMFVMQPFAVLQDKLKDQKVLWIDSDPKLVRAKIAVDLFGGDFKDSGSRYLDLFLKQDDLIIVFGKGLRKEIQGQITDMGLTNKRLLSIEVKMDDIPTIKENIVKQLSEVLKDG